MSCSALQVGHLQAAGGAGAHLVLALVRQRQLRKAAAAARLGVPLSAGIAATPVHRSNLLSAFLAYSAFAINPSLDPLSLGHFSPILRHFFAIFSLFPLS